MIAVVSLASFNSLYICICVVSLHLVYLSLLACIYTSLTCDYMLYKLQFYVKCDNRPCELVITFPYTPEKVNKKETKQVENYLQDGGKFHTWLLENPNTTPVGYKLCLLITRFS